MKVLGIGIILCLVWSPEARAQVFPGNLAGDKDLYVAVAGVATTLTATVQANSTAFPVASVANMVPYELLVIDNEIVEECSFNAGTMQVTIGKNSCPGADGRGIGGTTAATHAAGARVSDFITAEHHNAGRKEIEALENALGSNLSNIPGTAGGNPVPVTKGGTGATTQSGALSAIFGVTPLLANGLCFTQVAGPASCIAPGVSGTVLTSVGPTSLPVWQPGSGGGGNVTSVFGRTGTVAAQPGDYTAALVTNAVDQTQTYANPPWLTALPWTKITGAPAFITNPMLSPGDFIVGGTAGAPTRLAVPGTGTFCPNWSGGAVSWVSCPGSGGVGLTSVGITMPSAFTVSGSPLTSNGVITIAGAGSATQYINGLGQLVTFPTVVNSVFGRTGVVTAQAGDYTTAQVTEMTNLYYTNARVYAAISATAPITFTAGVIACPTCSTSAGGVTSVFGRTGAVAATTGDYTAAQVTNAESVVNKDVNGGYVGRSAAGNATLPNIVTALSFQSSDTTHTSLLSMGPGLSTNFPYMIATGQWGLFLDSSNGNKLTRQDSLGNNVLIEGAGGNVAGAPYTQTFTGQTSVALIHNLNLTNITAFNIDCFDTTNTLIVPSTVTATNANTVTVTFAVATSGSCTVTTGGMASGGGITQLTGDVTAGPGSGSQASVLATVNSAPGACGDVTHVCQVTTNAKGLVTGQSAIAIGSGTTANQNVRRITFDFDGGGSPLVGVMTRCTPVNFGGTIQQFALVGDVSGSATITVKGVALGAGYTGTAGFGGYTTIGTESPATVTFVKDTTLTGWTTAFAANTAVCVQVTAPSSYTWITGEIQVAAN